MQIMQARQDSNPQHPVLETGALPVGATGLLKSPLFYTAFFVQRMFTTTGAVFFEFELCGRTFLVLVRCVILSLANLTYERNELSHKRILFS